MHITSRRGTIVFFLILGITLVALAVALNVGWIILNWREGVLLFFGIVFFALIIAGMIVNTTFLLREIRRSEQHDSFINAVTHELKTPVASIRLHLETLQRRDLPEAQKQEFYRVMLSDTDRLTQTVEQVLRAGRAGDKKAGREKSAVDFRQLVRECMDAARTRHHLSANRFATRRRRQTAPVRGCWAMGKTFARPSLMCSTMRSNIPATAWMCGCVWRPPTKNASCLGCRIRGGHSRRRNQKHLQTFLPGESPLAGAREGHGAGTFHREVHCAKTWGQSIRGERGRRPGHNHHAGTPEAQRMSRVLVVEDEAHLAKGSPLTFRRRVIPQKLWATANPPPSA